MRSGVLIAFAFGFIFVLSCNAAADDVRIAAWNIKFFFDDDSSDDHSDLAVEMSAPSASAWQWRLNLVSNAIANINPDIIVLEEIENAKVVNDIAQKLHTQGKEYHVSFVQGNDSFTEQDVAFLVADGVPFTSERIPFTHQGESQYKDLSKHQLLTAEFDGSPVSLIGIHLITSAADRLKQARTLRGWTEDIGTDGSVIILGDTNVNTPYANTTAASDIGRIRGLNTASLNDDLADLHEFLTPQKRKTFADQRELDRILITRPLMSGSGPLKFKSIDNRRDLVVRGAQVDHASWATAEAERDLSDHFPLVATFKRTADSHPTPHALVEHAPASHGDEVSVANAELVELREEVRRLRRRIEQLETRNQ